jgi:hypothetical protein
MEAVLENTDRESIFTNILGRIVKHGFVLKQGLSLNDLRRDYPFLYKAARLDGLMSVPQDAKLVRVDRCKGVFGVRWYLVFLSDGIRFRSALSLPVEADGFLGFVMEFLRFWEENRILRATMHREKTVVFKNYQA